MLGGYGLQDVLAWLVVAGALGYVWRRFRPRRRRTRPDVPLERLTRKERASQPSGASSCGRSCH